MVKSRSPRLVERPKPGRSGAIPPVLARKGSHRSLLVGTPCTYRTSAPGALRQKIGSPSSSSWCSVLTRAGILPQVRTLCLGEALVDLVCERPVSGLAQADAFVPHFGGATANVCVTAARLGGDVALAGGAGDDGWGHW